MRNPSNGISPIIAVDRKATTPLHKQIYNAFRTAILRGDIRSGQQIPSSRELATEIKVSRFPVLNAYAQLQAEGYFESRACAGTFVSASLPEQLMSVQKPVVKAVQSHSGPRHVARRALLFPAFDRTKVPRGWGAFGVHQPAYELFPFQIWASLVNQHSKNPNANALSQVEPLGLERFREAICGYLRTARAVKCEPNQIMIVSGSQQALDITARVLLDEGDPVWVEEPGYVLQRTVLNAAGCRLVPVPVDKEGMNVIEGIKLHRRPRAIFVTPSHQYPLGWTMSASRRLQLLNWAQNSGAWIIEDDYDSEYRYESMPIASLQGMDVNSRVLYIGTFSKVLFPSIRIGYIVIPPDLVERFVAVRFAMDIFPPYLNQEVLTDFMNLGHFGRHIRKMRQVYSERRAVLVECLGNECGDLLELHGIEAGMNLPVTLPKGYRDQEISARAAQEKLWLLPLSPNYLGRPARQGFNLGFGSTEAKRIPGAVRKLRALLTS
jgi:GntR family transcriptional regulator/MocR family aminotransferase